MLDCDLLFVSCLSMLFVFILFYCYCCSLLAYDGFLFVVLGVGCLDMC